MRRWFVLLVWLAMLLAPIHARAQGSLRFSSVRVDIWPEYDRPAVLVIYHISLAPDTTLPASVTLRVPAQAEVYAVAYRDPTLSSLIDTPYDRTVQGDWAVLSIKAPSLEIQVEYYDALVKDKDGKTRHVTYQWAGDNAVDAFSVVFQQPAGATDLTINPAPAKSNLGQDNLTYYQTQAVSLSTGQPFTLTADYQKQTGDLSASALPIQPSGPVGANTAGRFSWSGILPWILGGLGVVLVVVALVVLVFWQKGSRGTAARRQHGPRRQESGPADDVYCHQCGKRAQPEDVFCRTCGTRLRRTG